MTDHDPQPAASLAAQLPGWKIWHGKHTGSWWAVPPAGHPHGDLVNATDLDALARKIQAADDARGVRRHRDMGPRGLRLRRVTLRECCQCGPRDVGPATTSVSNWRSRHPRSTALGIEPEVWRWYHSEVGKGEAAIVDTWWQTENGGFLGSTLPALQPMKPGSCGPGVLGVYPVIYDEDGNEVPKGSGKAGNICIRNPWPGIFQTIWGQPERFVDTYYRKYNRNPDSTDWRDWPYFAGDGAVQAADGYFRILGRVDDVINVAGHRLGTKEIESAALTVPEVAEAAAVPVIDDIRGRVVEMYVALKPGFEPGTEMAGKVSKAIETEIGKIARPKNVWIVPDMPKTRSGKIMRRVIASISNFADVGDVTTLANPEIVDDIRRHVQSAKVARDDVPRQLTEAEFEEIKKFGGE